MAKTEDLKRQKELTAEYKKLKKLLKKDVRSIKK